RILDSGTGGYDPYRLPSGNADLADSRYLYDVLCICGFQRGEGHQPDRRRVVALRIAYRAFCDRHGQLAQGIGEYASAVGVRYRRTALGRARIEQHLGRNVVSPGRTDREYEGE